MSERTDRSQAPSPVTAQDIDPPTGRNRARFEITPRGKLVLMLFHLAAGAAWLSGDANVRLAASLLAAPILLDLGWKLWAKPRFEVRVGPRRGIARAAFREHITLRNTSARAALRELRLREPRTLVGATGGAHLPWLPPGATVRIELAARHPRRGVATSRTLLAETDWPLALFRWQCEVAVQATMLSEPARIPIALNLLQSAERTREEQPAALGEELEFWSLREHRDGDDARRVHARRSAALGELVVTVWRGTEASERCIVIDTRRAPGMPDPRTARRFERALGHAAWLVDRWQREGVRFRVVAIQRELSSTQVTGTRDAREVLAWLAVAQVTPFRALSDEERRELADTPTRYWIAAGGYRHRGKGDARGSRVSGVIA